MIMEKTGKLTPSLATFLLAGGLKVNRAISGLENDLDL
jgi:hypothetical protein